jgi:hypothetical protein
VGCFFNKLKIEYGENDVRKLLTYLTFRACSKVQNCHDNFYAVIK